MREFRMRRAALIIATLVIAPTLCWAQLPAGDLSLTEEELTAWQLYQVQRFVDARESTERVLEANPDSIVGNAVMGILQRYGEGNLPRSLYRLRRARTLLEARFGSQPVAPGAREWHNRIIQETAFTAAEMERYEEELELWDLHDRLYDPDMPGERIWPLIQRREFDAARGWAAKAMAAGDRWSKRQAMNGLCALENEAGNRRKSYDWCIAHAREIMEIPGYGGVFLNNAGESARGIFRFDEAERYYLEAARRDVEWYANPWMDLSMLYLRAGRIGPAVQAIRSMHEYAQRRPPHTQQQDQSERFRAVAALLVIAGRPEQALPMTERALLYPDRRGGQSRSPEADLVTNALLHRRALLDSAERELERASTQGWWARTKASFSASWRRIQAYRASRRALAHLADPELLRGLLEAEGHQSFATPPWLAVDLVDVVGSGPVEVAIEASRSRAPADIPELFAYFDAYEAEARAARGDYDEAVELARRALDGLPAGEALLAARTRMILARAHEERGELDEAVRIELEVLQVDPTIFRRSSQALPLRVVGADDRLSQRVAGLLRSSPRVNLESESPLSLQVQAEGGSTCHLCFVMGGAEVGCASETFEDDGGVESVAQACADLFHEQLLAPRVDRSLFDSSSLDGGTTSGSLDDLLGPSTGP